MLAPPPSPLLAPPLLASRYLADVIPMSPCPPSAPRLPQARDEGAGVARAESGVVAAGECIVADANARRDSIRAYIMHTAGCLQYDMDEEKALKYAEPLSAALTKYHTHWLLRDELEPEDIGIASAVALSREAILPFADLSWLADHPDLLEGCENRLREQDARRERERYEESICRQETELQVAEGQRRAAEKLASEHQIDELKAKWGVNMISNAQFRSAVRALSEQRKAVSASPQAPASMGSSRALKAEKAAVPPVPAESSSSGAKSKMCVTVPLEVVDTQAANEMVAQLLGTCGLVEKRTYQTSAAHKQRCSNHNAVYETNTSRPFGNKRTRSEMYPLMKAMMIVKISASRSRRTTRTSTRTTSSIP
ncbi:hypothetical protein BC834DRAFT_670817 [Gloeopeniophorella convolvens]|nr:hypothetical protein BC834DRAFT_670817 [Gloeopeniophorella convolvens]